MSKITFSQKFWEDTHGRVVVWQKPNIWLTTWFIAMVIGWFLPNGWSEKFLSFVSLFAIIIWSILELTKGVNYFRRLLGLLILLTLVVSRL